MAGRTSPARTAEPAEPAPFEAKLTSPAGNEYTVTSPVEYYNLKAQGYEDVGDPAETIAAADQAATAQTPGPAEGATATPAAGNTGSAAK